ncbi:MAG TPA: methyltransferase [Caulobacteraceae bacterium]|nr:methyltransferase [Caulobacteraceae bacterium]
MTEAVYGAPPLELATSGADAIQVSPLVLGAASIEALEDRSLARMIVAAPPGVLERRYALAHALRALAPDGELIALAPKTRGGSRLGQELRSFGCDAAESGRRHHRICVIRRPAKPSGLAEAIAAGAPQFVEALQLWSQPGVFSWDQLDEGTSKLLAVLPPLAGRGADLGCGLGVLSLAVLRNAAVTELTAIDIDRRAVEAARRNVTNERARIVHGDVRQTALSGLDFVVTNPPFHAGGREDRDLGAGFIAAAARALRRGGRCLLVANVALPYEAPLGSAFRQVRTLDRSGGYKVLEAVL